MRSWRAWAGGRTCFQLGVITSPGSRRDCSWRGLGERWWGCFFCLCPIPQRFPTAPPAPLSSWSSDHILSQPSGCFLRSRRLSQSSFCVPEVNVALHGKSTPDVAELLLLQCHDWGWGPGRAWGHGDSRRDLLGGQDLKASTSWRGLSHPLGNMGRGTVSSAAGCSPGRADGGTQGLTSPWGQSLGYGAVPPASG